MVNQLPKYPIGVQTFAELINDKYLYVDKTSLVYNVANSYKFVFLSRPRRFGKSLLISTIQAYFEGRRELFNGLKIDALEKEWVSYPVLRFDLSAANYNHPDVLKSKLSTSLAEMEMAVGTPVLQDVALGDRFRLLIKATFRKAGKPVVVLIDEYDKPMLDSLQNESLNSELKGELRGFYSTLKECDAYIRYAMLTGVTKFGKVSVFSGLNNLNDISMMPEYNDICGITQEEFLHYFKPSIRIFAERNEISEEEVVKGFKEYYDGYHFARKGADMYNPFSTLLAFAHNDFGSYWFSTGSSSYLVDLIKRSQFILQDLEGTQRTASALGDITDTSEDIVPLLYQAGYLTIKDYDQRFRMYTLGFPNREVSEGFWDCLGRYFFLRGRNITEFSLNHFVFDLEHGDADKFMLRLQSMFASISSEHEADKEIHYQNMMTIIIKMLGYAVSTEIHSSYGRSDIEIEAGNYIYIIELKLDSSADVALRQIHERGYSVRHNIDNRNKILIGAEFSTKTRTLSEWKIEYQS